MFSPYYANARRRGGADPADHIALNVALYGPNGKRWTMTERRRESLRQRASGLDIGPSCVEWDGNALTFTIEERAVPLPTRVCGRVRLIPYWTVCHTTNLDAAGRHRWSPLAPSARVEVQLRSPDLHWSGDGYWDCNEGGEPLESAIRGWSWSRAKIGRNTCVIYDTVRRDESRLALALHFASSGAIDHFEPPPPAELPSTRWRIARTARADAGVARVERTLEDTPFYARSVVSSRLLGQAVTGVHESLDLDRFRSRMVQALLRFRMPRSRR